MEKSSSQLDRTDELPVLSEEAIRAEQLAETNPPGDSVAELIELLWETFERTDQRWQQLESRLATQAAAIEKLCERFAPGPAGIPAPAPRATVAHLKFMPAPAAGLVDEDTGRVLRGRLGALEEHIAERSGLWRSMESELARQAERIALLEQVIGGDEDGSTDSEPPAPTGDESA